MTKLFNEFQGVSKSEWLEKVLKDLKGRPLEALDWHIGEQLTQSPFAHPDDWPEPPPPLLNDAPANNWIKGVHLSVEDPVAANAMALYLLEHGATALSFDFKNTPDPHFADTLFQNINPEWIYTHFEFPSEFYQTGIKAFADFIQKKHYDPSKVQCAFQAAPMPAPRSAFLKEISNRLPKSRLFTIPCHWAGDEQVIAEISEALSAGNALLEQLHDAGCDLWAFYPKIQFSVVMSDSYFLNIAKMRALRWLWAEILRAWNPAFTGNIFIEARITPQTQSEDEHYNKIKATAQAMAAAIAGADTLYIWPSDAFKSKQGSDFSLRIALNIHHLMELESHMHRVKDPAAGSYYIENLTAQIAEKAWAAFSKA